MDAILHKICCVCRLDVSRMPRTKDPRGNYYCKPCYNTLLAAYQQRVQRRAEVEPAPPAPVAIPVSTPEAEAAVVASLALDASEPADSGALGMELAAEAADAAPSVAPTSLAAEPASSEFCLTAMPANAEGLRRVESDSTFSIGRALARAATALAQLRPASESAVAATTAMPVMTRRVRRRMPRNALRLSDLVGEEALAEVEAARIHPRFREPEIPVSPITNVPVSAMVGEYSTASQDAPFRSAGHEAQPPIHTATFGRIAVHPAM